MAQTFDKSLESRAQAELAAARHVVITVNFSVVNLLLIVGALQLALRHPLFTGPGSKVVRQFIYYVKGLLAQQPALCELIECGFDDTFDWDPDEDDYATNL